MTVKLEVGMTAIRRDGERKGPVQKREVCINSEFSISDYSFIINILTYSSNGQFLLDQECDADIIAAGYPWVDLGAKPGDTVRCVWNGDVISDFTHICGECVPVDGSALYVIILRAAKPAGRPRAAHKLDLRDGDVVELAGWQDGTAKWIGHLFKFNNADKVLWGGAETAHGFHVPSQSLKGHRPLFRVISRAEDAKNIGFIEALAKEQIRKNVEMSNLAKLIAKPEMTNMVAKEKLIATGCLTPKPYEVITIHKRDKAYHLTFPHGSDVGTVIREEL